MAKLYYKYGVMGAGKSTSVIQTIYNYKRNNMKVLVVKPKIDSKGDNKIVSRVGLEQDVDILLEENKTIYNYLNKLRNIKCIIVDECQFLNYKQSFDFWKVSKEYDIPVIGYGLKSNFRGELFEGSRTLIGLADDLSELKTICQCGKSARFNARKVNNEFTTSGDEFIIDGETMVEYVPLCGDCYLEYVLKEHKKMSN